MTDEEWEKFLELGPEGMRDDLASAFEARAKDAKNWVVRAEAREAQFETAMARCQCLHCQYEQVKEERGNVPGARFYLKHKGGE